MYAHIRMYSPNFMDKAVLMISTQDTFVTFRTFDAFYGRSQRIYVRISKLEAWLEDDDQEHFEDRDLHSSIRFYRRKDKLYTELVSLRENDGELKGFIHRFCIDPDQLAYILTTRYEDHRLLITTHEQQSQAKLIIPKSTQSYIRETILPDKKLKRAFIKAISRSFMYGKESEITLHHDYDGFFFRETNGICGGLIIGRNIVSGHDAVGFTVHT